MFIPIRRSLGSMGFLITSGEAENPNFIPEIMVAAQFNKVRQLWLYARRIAGRNGHRRDIAQHRGAPILQFS
jgi:hypothetical protein